MPLQSKINWIVMLFLVSFFFITGFLILNDQYTKTGVWFTFSQLHHETFAMLSFALAIGIFVGAIIQRVTSQQ